MRKKPFTVSFHLLVSALLGGTSGIRSSPLHEMFPGIWEQYKSDTFGTFISKGGAEAVLRMLDVPPRGLRSPKEGGMRLLKASLTPDLPEAVALSLFPLLNIHESQLKELKSWLKAPNVLLVLPHLMKWENSQDPHPFKTAALATYAQHGEKKPFGRGWTDVMTVHLVKQVPHEKWAAFRLSLEQPKGLLSNPYPIVKGEELLSKLTRYRRYPLVHVVATLQNDPVRSCCRVYHEEHPSSSWFYKDKSLVNPVLDFFMGIPLEYQGRIATFFLLYPLRELTEDSWPPSHREKPWWYIKTTPEKILAALQYLEHTPFHTFLMELDKGIRQQVIFEQCLAGQNIEEVPLYLEALRDFTQSINQQMRGVVAAPVKERVKTELMGALSGAGASLLRWVAAEMKRGPPLFAVLSDLGNDPLPLFQTWKGMKEIKKFWIFLGHDHLKKWQNKLLPASEASSFLSCILPALSQKGEPTFIHTMQTICWLWRLTASQKEEAFSYVTLRKLVGIPSFQLEQLARLLKTEEGGASWLLLWGTRKAREAVLAMAGLSSYAERCRFIDALRLPFEKRKEKAGLSIADIYRGDEGVEEKDS